MKNRKEFIESVYNANKNGLLYPKFLCYRDYDDCKMSEIMSLFKVLAKSENISNGDYGCTLVDYENDGNERCEKYELNVCLLMITLIVNSRFRKSDTKFECNLKKYYQQEAYHQRMVENLFYFLGSAYPNSLRKFFPIAKDIICRYGPCDMLQLFNDLLDWDYDGEIASRWADEITSGIEGGYDYAE